MPAKPALIAVAIAGALAVGTGGYFANEWRVCREMEQDYLRMVDGYGSNVQAAGLAATAGVEVDHQRQEDLRQASLRLQQMQLTRIYERCGTQAGEGAADTAGKKLLGG